jgi:transcriptional regulator with XRE-family HTH domain
MRDYRAAGGLVGRKVNMLGRVVRSWREKEGITIREAAKIIGFSYSTLSRIENGLTVDGRNLTKLLLWLLQDTDTSAGKGREQ